MKQGAMIDEWLPLSETNSEIAKQTKKLQSDEQFTRSLDLKR